MSAKEKEAAAKQTFTFLAPLTNEHKYNNIYGGIPWIIII